MIQKVVDGKVELFDTMKNKVFISLYERMSGTWVFQYDAYTPNQQFSAFPSTPTRGASARRFLLYVGIGQGQLDEIVETINDSGANICFVGLGCPRQERFVGTVGQRLNMPSLAVGAAFDYIAGNIDRAPEALQKAGLEWLYRTMQEPRRLGPRYLDTNSRFVAGVAKQFAATVARRPADAHAAPPFDRTAHHDEMIDA